MKKKTHASLKMLKLKLIKMNTIELNENEKILVSHK